MHVKHQHTNARFGSIDEIIARWREHIASVIGSITSSFYKGAAIEVNKAAVVQGRAKLDLRNSLQQKSFQQRTKQMQANYQMAKNGQKWSHPKRKQKRKIK